MPPNDPPEITLPITAQGFDHPHQFGLKRRMARGDGGKSLGVGQPSQLVQIAGKTLELDEPFEMLTPQPLADRAVENQLPQHLGTRNTCRTGQSAELEVAGSVAPQGNAVLLFSGPSQRRTAPFLRCVHGLEFLS